MRNLKFTNTQDWVWLIIAAAVSVLFIVFSTPIIDTIYPGDQGYYDIMEENRIYSVMALSNVIIIWAICGLYYLLIDSVSMSSFWKWFWIGIVTIGIAFCADYFIASATFDESNKFDIFFSDILFQTIWLIPVNAILYLLTSIGLKGFSGNCGTRPF